MPLNTLNGIRISAFSRALTLFLLLMLLAALAFQADARLLLEYQRDFVQDGQWWRLISAHLVHLSLPHWAGNSLGVLLLWFLNPQIFQPRILSAALLFCSLFTGFGLYFLALDLPQYAGFSGVLHGLLCLALLLRPRISRVDYALLTLLLVKVLWELSPAYDSYALQDVIGGRIEVRAHALGLFAGGSFYGLVAMYRRRYSIRSTTA